MPETETPKKSDVVEAKPPALITVEELRAELADLVDRGHAAGLRPLQIMLSVYAEKGISTTTSRSRAIIDSFFDALDGSKKRD